MDRSAAGLLAVLGATLYVESRRKPECPEIHFWRTVLLNALRDAQNPAYVSSPSERAVVIAQSRNWPLKDCRWSDKRCEMADVNADMVRARARQVLQ